MKISVIKISFLIKNIQSNLCTTATLGTPKKWPLFRGWSKILSKLIVGLVGKRIKTGHYFTGGSCSEVAISIGLTGFLMPFKEK